MVFLECGGDGGWLGVLGGYVKEGRLRPGGDGQRWRRARSRVVTPGGHENSGAASRRKRQLPSPSVGPSVADVVDHSLHRQARRRRVVSSVSRKRPPGGGTVRTAALWCSACCGAALPRGRDRSGLFPVPSPGVRAPGARCGGDGRDGGPAMPYRATEMVRVAHLWKIPAVAAAASRKKVT